MFSKATNFLIYQTNIGHTFMLALLLSAFTLLAPFGVGAVYGFKYAIYTFLTLSLLTTYNVFIVRKQFQLP